MKKMVYRYRISKFRRFASGLLFAVIAVIAIILCLIGLSDQAAVNSGSLLPFAVAIISMLLGFFSMFHPEGKKI